MADSTRRDVDCILALDLGKFSSVACTYDPCVGRHAFTRIQTRPQAVHDLIVRELGDSGGDGRGGLRGRVVIEIGSQAGWVKDLCEALAVPIEVANPNHEAWRWKNVKRKTDRDDALKLARLSAVGQLPTVSVPPLQVRQWRGLILYRAKLMSRRKAVQNHIRSLLDRQGIAMAMGSKAWTNQAVETLEALALPLDQCEVNDLWRGQLAMELAAYAQIQRMVHQVEDKLDALAAPDERVQRLRTIPGVGPRLSELLVAVIDDPRRFKSRKQVGAYIGLTPRQIASGTMNRQTGISKAGHRLLRSLLVEVSWLMLRHNPLMRRRYDQVCRGCKGRRKIAAVATARQLLVICWAMLRDGTSWSPPPKAPPEAPPQAA